MTKEEKAVVRAAERFFWAWRQLSGVRGPLSRSAWLVSSEVPAETDRSDRALIRVVRAHLQSKQKKGGK